MKEKEPTKLLIAMLANGSEASNVSNKRFHHLNLKLSRAATAFKVDRGSQRESGYGTLPALAATPILFSETQDPAKESSPGGGRGTSSLPPVEIVGR
jgi:hypothetical protein